MRSITILLSLLLCVNLGAQKSKTVISIWQENADENPDTSFVEYSFHQKGRIYYFLSNNNEYVWFLIKTSDHKVQNAILKSGMTLWIDMDNKEGMKLGVRYPVGSLNQTKTAGLPDENNNSNTNPKDFIAQANTIELIGFIGEEARRFPSDNYDNFRGLMSFDANGTLHYLLRMPAIKLPLRNSKDGVGAMPFSLGVQFGSDGNKSDPIWIKNVRLATGL